MGFFDSLPPSFGNKFIVNAVGASISNLPFGKTVKDVFSLASSGVDTAGVVNSAANALTGSGALAPSAPSEPSAGWTFITAPEDISWEVANAASRVDMFGTNNPPVVAGSRGMRDLKLGNSLAEGFIRGVSLNGKIEALENLLNYSLNTTDGFVSVPVYQVWANNRSYGGSEAYYIIKSVNVKESMRDLDGNTTRAYVDVDFMQVPKYQVNSGRDSAGKTTSSAAPALDQIAGAAISAASQAASQANQKVGAAGADGKAKAGADSASAENNTEARRPSERRLPQR